MCVFYIVKIEINVIYTLFEARERSISSIRQTINQTLPLNVNFKLCSKKAFFEAPKMHEKLNNIIQRCVEYFA